MTSPSSSSVLRQGKSSGVLPRLVSSRPIARGRRPTPTMAFADFCPIPGMLPCRARPHKSGRQSGQISPDKNVNCRYTTAAFTVSPESAGLRHVVLTCPDDGLICCFCSSAHGFALRLPSDPSSRRRPCRRLGLVAPSRDGAGFYVQGTCTP